MEININLNELICDNFVNIAIDIIDCNVDRAIFKGGRNSTKSQCISECIITGCMKYKQSAVCIVKYGNKVKERLVDTMLASLSYMHLEKFWKLRKSPFELVLLDEKGNETNTSIRFTGCDDPESLKSYRARGGSTFRYVWVEELTNFNNMKEVNNLIQTMTRGDGDHTFIASYNPPQRSSNWVNKEFDVPAGKVLGHDSNEYKTEYTFELNGEYYQVSQVVNHSTYLNVIESGHSNWLGLGWIGEAEKTKVENNQYYRFAYLGEVTGTDANVFNNIREWDGDISKIDARQLYRGLDWGNGGPDPMAGVVWAYDKKNHYIYAIDEFYGSKMDIPQVVEHLKEINKNNFPVYGDGAVPLLNQQLVNRGLNILNVKKGPDSILAGIKFLQSLNGIFINKYRTPNIYREFTQYEYELDKEENITSKLPDKNNHTIDGTRYAFCPEIRYN